MLIRSLKTGEEAAWVGLNGDAGQCGARIQDLVKYRRANPGLHPCTFLVALQGDRLIGKLRTNTDDDTLYGLASLSVDPAFVYAETGGALVEYAKEVFTDRPLEAGSWEKPEDDAWHDLLLRTGFQVYIEKCYYRRDLAGYRSPYPDPFSYRSLAEVGEAEFVRQFVRIYPGNPNRNFNNDDPRAEFFELQLGAGKTYDPRQWQIACLDGEPAGIVIAKIFDDIPEEGTIHTFGLFPEFRGRGLGKILHAKGLESLASTGALRYVGSTDRLNRPMIATFIANGCWHRGTRRQYRLKTPRSK